MAFRAVVLAAVVALAYGGMDAGYMQMMGGAGNGGMNMMNMMNMMQNMMGGNQQQQQQGHQQQGSGCNPADPKSGGCTIPQGVDMGEYLKEQMEQQQFENKEMAEKIKARFEAAVKEVTMKKHRYAMSVMTEFTSMCACAGSSAQIYQSMFVENAQALNLTDVVDLTKMNSLPYQAKNAKEARELIFAGMINALCTSLGEYMNFAEQVERNIDIFRNPQSTGSPVGK